ncbi:MAG: isopeptide-forming domain-containing fimbrial protein [Planctomycetaceae bacterium]
MTWLSQFSPSFAARGLSRSWLFAFFAGSSLACCSCTTMQSLARTEDFTAEIQRAKQAQLQQVAAAQNEPMSEASTGVARIAGKKRDSGIQLASYEEAACPPEAISSCPPEPRTPMAGPNPFAVGIPAGEACVCSPESYPDEYLCDGGDRDWPVHYSSRERYGLDTEDTIAEYVDHTGQEQMKPTNKVCVYAPRFAAVRTVSQPVQNEMVDEAAGMTNAGVGDELRSRVSSVLKTKRDPTGNLRVRSRASGVEMDEPAVNVVQDVTALQHEKLINLFQNFTFAAFIDLDQTTAARLNYGLAAAEVWTREQNPVIAGKVEVPTVGQQEVTATALTVIEERETPGCLQIVKFADLKDALPGDVITFTIRYRNVGGREVNFVRIVDNLTPRLEYIEDSTDSDRGGVLTTEDNGEGSLVLTWALADPLPADAAGTITFQARVR